MIIVPSKKFIEADPIESLFGMEGWYTLRAVRASGRVTAEQSFRYAGPFHNLITNLGLDRLGSLNVASVYSQCFVGTGTTPPSVTDQSLANYKGDVSGGSGSGSNTSGNSGAPDYYSWRRWTYRSAVGGLGNVIITEVGIGGGQNLLFSRELIRDALGNPSTFPLQEDEQLEVSYELRWYPPLADVPATIQVGSATHDTVTRALDVTSENWRVMGLGFPFGPDPNQQASDAAATGPLVPITSAATSGTLGNSSTKASLAYQPGSYERILRTTWGPPTANGNIAWVKRQVQSCAFQVSFSPPIVKTNTQILTLDHSFKWGRR